MHLRGLVTDLVLLGVLWGCDLPKLVPDIGTGSEGCQEAPYGSVQWTISGFYRQEQLVEPAAVPLVAKVRVDEQVSLWIVSSFCGSSPAAEWTSTVPQVATVSGIGDSATLTGVSEGRTVVYAMKHGSRADLEYYCCGSCESPTPPPRCQEVPIESVQVVP